MSAETTLRVEGALHPALFVIETESQSCGHISVPFGLRPDKSQKEFLMKKISIAVLVSLASITGIAFAQSAPTSEIRESTDPAKISSIEQRARELAASPQASTQADTKKGGQRASKQQHAGKHVAKSNKQRDMSSGAGRTGDSSTASPAGK
jgi:hypothetical protein